MPSNQVKLPGETKREIEVFAALSGKSQGALLAEAWAEYKASHTSELTAGIENARRLLADPVAASIAAAGITDDEMEAARVARPTPRLREDR